METFEITIPAHGDGLVEQSLEIQADHWIEAWSRAVELLGHGPADPGRVDCTFGDDGAIEVVDRDHGRRLVLRCVRVFRGRDITLDSLTDLCAAPARPANAFAITRPSVATPVEDSISIRKEEHTPATEILMPALGWLALDLGKATDPQEAAGLVLECFPCELVVFLSATVDPKSADWSVVGAVGERSRRLRGATLSRTSPLPPRQGALVGRRTFPDETRAIRFGRRVLGDTVVPVRSVIWTAIPSLGVETTTRLMLINGGGPAGFGDQELSAVVSLARALGARWGEDL
jgi:hypothetical protein